MGVKIHNWKKQITEQASNPEVNISYVGLSTHAGRGLYSSIIPPGGSNTGHWHPDKDEYYHIVKGSGIIVTQMENLLSNGTSPDRQEVSEGMSFNLPARLVHRIFNTGAEPLTFFFECPLEHMDVKNPVRTMVKDFGEAPQPRPSAG